MSQSKQQKIANKLVYKGHVYHRADTVEGVMWQEFGAMIQRLSKIANSEDMSTVEKLQRSKQLWDEIHHYAQQIGLR